MASTGQGGNGRSTLVKTLEAYLHGSAAGKNNFSLAAVIRIIAVGVFFPYDKRKKEVTKMFGNKYKLSYDERRIIVLCLIEMKNKLIKENRYTDAIDDLLVKFLDD